MKSRDEILAEIARINADDRLAGRPATVFNNAPLALIQVELKARRDALQWALEGAPRAALPRLYPLIRFDNGDPENPDYRRGFDAGHDGAPRTPPEDATAAAEYNTGYDDGAAVAAEPSEVG